jgi:hypothetical protein
MFADDNNLDGIDVRIGAFVSVACSGGALAS